MAKTKTEIVKDYAKSEVKLFLSVVKDAFVGLIVSVGLGILFGVISSDFFIGLLFFLLSSLFFMIRITIRLFKMHKAGKKEKRKLATDLMGEGVGNEVMDIIEIATDGKSNWSSLDAMDISEKLVSEVSSSTIIKDSVKDKLNREILK